MLKIAEWRISYKENGVERHVASLRGRIIS